MQMHGTPHIQEILNRMTYGESAWAIRLLDLKLQIAEEAVWYQHLQEVVHFLRELHRIGIAVASSI